MRWLSLLIVLPVAIVSRAAEPLDTKPLKRWVDRQGEVKTVQADFTQTRSFRALRDPLASPGHLWFKAPDLFRWESGEPAKMIFLRKGEVSYFIQPAKRRADRIASSEIGKAGSMKSFPLMKFPLAKDYADFIRQFEVQAISVEGSRCHTEVLPRDADARKFLNVLKLDFDTSDGHLLSFEVSTRDGSSMRNEFSNVRLNQKIDPRMFDFDLTGYEVSDAKN